MTGSEGSRANVFRAVVRKPGPRRGRSRGEARSSRPGRCAVWGFTGVKARDMAGRWGYEGDRVGWGSSVMTGTERNGT